MYGIAAGRRACKECGEHYNVSMAKQKITMQGLKQQPVYVTYVELKYS
jgi:hypothetical protein